MSIPLPLQSRASGQHAATRYAFLMWPVRLAVYRGWRIDSLHFTCRPREAKLAAASPLTLRCMPALPGRATSLNADYRSLCAAKRFDAYFLEAGLLHPAPAFGLGVFEPAGGLDQHVKACEQAVRANPARIVYESVAHDQRAA